MSQSNKPNKTRKQGPGYHITTIKKGVVGELSKVMEECKELQDAEQQGVRIMALVELSDMHAAIFRYLERHYPDVTMEELESMAASTEYGNLQCKKQGTSKTILNEIKGAFLVARDKRVLKSLSRVIGATQLYLRHNYPGMYFTGMTLKDLSLMSAVTRRAFDNGYR